MKVARGRSRIGVRSYVGANNPIAAQEEGFETVYTVAPGVLTIESAADISAQVPDVGNETSNIVDAGPAWNPPNSGSDKPGPVAHPYPRPGARSCTYRQKEEEAQGGSGAGVGSKDKVRVASAQVLPVPIMGLLLLGLSGATLQAYMSSADSAFVVAFGAGAAFTAWKLLELRAEFLLDSDKT